MKFDKVCEENDIATLKAKYQAEKEKKEAAAAKKAEYDRDLDVTRTRLTDTKGNLIPMKYLKKDDQRYTKYLDSILNKFDAGTLLIDFAVNPENEDEIMLDVEYRGDCVWLFSKGKQSTYKEDAKGPIQRFKSVGEFIDSMTTSMYNINQGVDRKMVRDNLFDPESFKRVTQQIRDFADDYPNKGKALQYDNGKWDMEIKFRRSLRRLSGQKFPDDVSSRYVIYPAISGENKWGRIIAPDEEERYDPSLWEELLRFGGKIG